MALRKTWLSFVLLKVKWSERGGPAVYRVAFSEIISLALCVCVRAHILPLSPSFSLSKMRLSLSNKRPPPLLLETNRQIQAAKEKHSIFSLTQTSGPRLRCVGRRMVIENLLKSLYTGSIHYHSPS